MRFRTVPATIVVLLLATIAVAQTKISGTSTCGKPDQQQKIDVGDKPGHAFTISQGKCNWTKPMDLAGIQTKEDVVTNKAPWMRQKAPPWQQSRVGSQKPMA
jgi:hypothetical protein